MLITTDWLIRLNCIHSWGDLRYRIPPKQPTSSFNSGQLSMWAQLLMLASIILLIDSTESKTLMFTYHLPWCVAGTISVGGRSTGKWTTADTWIIFKVYDCEQRKYWKRKHKEERKKQNLFILQRLWS